jgi:hypothetical protein
VASRLTRSTARTFLRISNGVSFGINTCIIARRRP